MITNPHELWLAISGDKADSPKDAKEQIKRAIYKGTNCGAWVAFDKDGVAVGSIVEGVDEGTRSYNIKYPFNIKEFWKKLDCVEAEAQEIWNDTHGCEDCGPEDEETGCIAINPDCKTCHGEGTIL